MLPLAEAQAQVLAEAFQQKVSAPLLEAVSLRLAESIISPQYSPLFDNSAMDGYAVRQAAAARYQVVGEVAAGQLFSGQLQPGQAVRIMTGAAVPASADAVVPVEEIQQLSESEIEVVAQIRSGQHIRRQGEEFQPGELLLPEGARLNPASIGLLASLGYSRVPVWKKPRVAILATGSELLAIEDELQPGKLRDSNSAALAASVQALGAEAHCLGILPDDKTQIRAALTTAFENADIVLTSGGVSVGDYDYVQEILLEMGLQQKFWKVAIKPGKPVLFGTLDQKLCFGLPGNPASALVVFELLVRPVILKMSGQTSWQRPFEQAVLTSDVRATTGRLHVMRVRLEAGQVSPFKGQGSSNLLTISQANALLPVYQDYQAGQQVGVWVLEQG